MNNVKIEDDIISSKALKSGSVTNSKLADLSVTTPKISDNSITKQKLCSDSVGTNEIENKSITRDKLADDVISDGIPVGTIAQFTSNVLPSGWLFCDGAKVSKNTYPSLLKVLTSKDDVLSTYLPNLNIKNNNIVKYAIKAFSDTVEFASLNIAGLTQDIANNNLQIENLKQKNTEVILWEGDIFSGDIVLHNDLHNYQQIYFNLFDNKNNQKKQICLLTSSIEKDLDIELYNCLNRYFILQKTDTNKLKLQTNSNIKLQKITALK